MKKRNKKNDNYKKYAMYIASVLLFLMIFILINEIIISKRQSYSEIISLGNIKLDKYNPKRTILSSYKDYKLFLKENNLKDGHLKNVDFKKNNYLLLTETYAKGIEKNIKKVNEISNSSNSGIIIKLDFYNYCDNVKDVELLAYLIPLRKDIFSIKDINVTYNNLNNINCSAQ